MWKLGVLLTIASALAGLAAVSSSALPSGHFGDPAPASFRLPDGSAGCRFFASGEIACRAATLGPGENWWNGTVSCRIAHGSIACSTIAGGTVEVGATRLAATAPAPTA